ncbi:MAG: hypothetical protein QM820_15185 [Minicystis sp.]
MMIGASFLACGPAPAPLPISPSPARIDIPSPPLSPAIAAPPVTVVAPPVACSLDIDCGYEPSLDRCTADPRANRQPPLIDQGILCYCDDREHRCSTLHVPPVPCESDASCAVRLDPRPHPVAASVTRPHERGRACRDFVFSTTCERTNICTMHHHTCPGSKR